MFAEKRRPEFSRLFGRQAEIHVLPKFVPEKKVGPDFSSIKKLSFMELIIQLPALKNARNFFCYCGDLGVCIDNGVFTMFVPDSDMPGDNIYLQSLVEKCFTFIEYSKAAFEPFFLRQMTQDLTPARVSC